MDSTIDSMTLHFYVIICVHVLTTIPRKIDLIRGFVGLRQVHIVQMVGITEGSPFTCLMWHLGICMVRSVGWYVHTIL